MPKGDRLKLKADPEDGTTPIANLLLEAVAMAKFSGLQVRAIIYLWRKTYGWVGNDGNRLKECKIGLTDWAEALDSSNSRVSHILQELVEKSIIKRRILDVWGGYYYSLNTDISSWNSDCLKLHKLCNKVGIPSFATIDENATVPLQANSKPNSDSRPNSDSIPNGDTTIDENATAQLTKTQPPTLYKERLKKGKETRNIQKDTYGEFNNVYLANDERDKLIAKFGDKGFWDRVEKLSCGIASKGYKYKNHYATILAWERMDDKKGSSKSLQPKGLW